MTTSAQPTAPRTVTDPLRTRPLTALRVFVSRDWDTARSYKLPFVLNAISTIFQVALFFFISRVFDGPETGTEALPGGYFGFVIVGLIAFSLVNTALGSFAAKLRTEQLTGTFEALIASPTPLPVTVLSSAAYDLIAALPSSALTLLTAMALGFRLEVSPASVVAGIVALIGTVTLSAALGIGVAAFTVVFKQGQSASTLVAQAVALVGGVYFPLSVLPAGMQDLARLFPFAWALSALRAAFLEARVEAGLIAALCAAGFIGLLISLRLLAAAVERARRSGTLAQY